MGCALLGEQFDLHGGGADLQFPHHENEIAQGEGATGKMPARVWAHNGLLNVDHVKMSKSLGNFFTIRDVLERYDGETIRFFMLRTHYRSPFNFSDASLDDARSRVRRLYTALDGIGRWQAAEIDWSATPSECSSAPKMNDDFNTPGAVAVLFELAERRQPKPHSATSAGIVEEPRGVRSVFLQQLPRAFLPVEAVGLRTKPSIAERISAARVAAKEDARLRASPIGSAKELADSGRRAARLSPGHDLDESLTVMRNGKSEGAPGPTADYWDEACKHLSKRDRVMRKLIPSVRRRSAAKPW